MYLAIKKMNGYDDFYYKLDDSNTTWAETMEYIELALDDQYIKNDNKIEGVKLKFEIVSELPEGICENL